MRAFMNDSFRNYIVTKDFQTISGALEIRPRVSHIQEMLYHCIEILSPPPAFFWDEKPSAGERANLPHNVILQISDSWPSVHITAFIEI